MSLTITIPGAVNVTTGSFAPAVLTIGVGVPGAQGPQGPAGQGVPTGGTAGQFLQKTTTGIDYATDWTTVNLSAYAVKSNNLSDLTSASTARTNLGLGTMATASAADYSTTTVANGLYYPLSGNPSSFLTASALTGYATQSFVAANYAPIAAGLPTGGTVGQVLTKNSGTDYDDSWQTLIPGDRYLTTSTTSNSVSNGSKTFTVGTGLSYSSQQDVVISYDASNHMHARVTSYNSGTGVLVVDVQSHTGAGTYASWTVNVGGMVPLQTVEWGEILGVLGDQTDLATALNGKLETSTAASTYAALAGATFTGEVVTPASTTSNAGLTITPGVAPTTPTNGELWATTNDLQVRLNGVTETIAEQSWVTAGFYPLTGNPSGFLTSASLSGYALLSGATFTGLVNTLASSTAGAGFRLPHGAAPTTPTDGDVWTTTGNLWVRISGASQAVALQGSSAQLSSNNIFTNASSTYGNSTAAGTINIGTGATVSASTRTINIGTASAAGSTNNINIGGGSGTITTTVAGTLTATGTTLNLGNSTAASTINVGTGATLSGSTKTINIGTNGVLGSTNVINIGPTATSGNINFNNNSVALGSNSTATTAAADTNSTALATTAYVVGQAGSATPLVDGTAAVGTSLRYARQDHVHPTDTSRAALASPTFTGTPAAPTAAADTNTTQLATTAFVVGQAGSATPLVDGTAAVGTSLRYARQDHVHPTDTSRAALASPTFTGTPAAPTAAADTNTTQLATTAFVVAQAGSATPLVDGTAAVGTSLRYARQDHVHPTDTTRAPLASPAFIGTPSLPTGTTAVTQSAGNNTTAVATTAFVTAAVPAFATTAEINAPTSTTKAVTPWDVVRMITNRASFETLSSSPVFSTSGTGAEAYKYSNDRLIWLGTPNTTISGWGQTIFETTIAANGLLGAKRGSTFNNKDFNKKIIMSGTVCFNSLGDANTVFRMMLGGRNTTTNGDPTRESVGFKVVGGGSNAMVLVTYGFNGSTSVVTETTSSFTPVVNQTFDWMIYHEPDPAVPANSKAYLYINDSLVATGINSPSTQNVGSNYMVQTCETTASHATRMTAVLFPVKIWWSR